MHLMKNWSIWKKEIALFNHFQISSQDNIQTVGERVAADTVIRR